MRRRGRGCGQQDARPQMTDHLGVEDLDKKVEILRQKWDIMQRKQHIMNMKFEMARKRQYEQSHHQSNIYDNIWEPSPPKRFNAAPEQEQPYRGFGLDSPAAMMQAPMSSNFIPSLFSKKIECPPLISMEPIVKENIHHGIVRPPPLNRSCFNPPIQAPKVPNDLKNMVLREDQIPNKKVTGRLEVALGSIVKDLKSDFAHNSTFKDLSGSVDHQRILKQAVRERIRTVMLNQTVGSVVDIVKKYRKKYPKDTDNDIVDLVINTQQPQTVTVTQTDKNEIQEVSVKTNCGQGQEGQCNKSSGVEEIEKKENGPATPAPTPVQTPATPKTPGAPAGKQLPYEIKLIGRPKLPARNVIREFLNNYRPTTIKKHKSINNLLVVGFVNEDDYKRIILANGTVLGDTTILIKTIEKVNSVKENNSANNGKQDQTETTDAPKEITEALKEITDALKEITDALKEKPSTSKTGTTGTVGVDERLVQHYDDGAAEYSGFQEEGSRNFRQMEESNSDENLSDDMEVSEADRDYSDSEDYFITAAQSQWVDCDKQRVEKIREVKRKLNCAVRKRFSIMLNDNMPWQQALELCQRRWSQLPVELNPRKRRRLERLQALEIPMHHYEPKVKISGFEVNSYFLGNRKNARVRIVSTDGLCGEKMDMILHVLTAMIMRMNKGEAPRFDGYVYAQGALMISCRDKQSQKWLVDTVPHLQPWPAARLAASATRAPAAPQIVHATVPRTEATDMGHVFSLLKAQNRGFNTEDWSLVSTKDLEEGTLMVVSVDQRTVEALRESAYRACLGFKTISFRHGLPLDQRHQSAPELRPKKKYYKKRPNKAKKVKP